LSTQSKTKPESAIAIYREPSIEPWRDPDWQRLWLALQSSPWKSLALVSAASGAPADFTLRIAVTLARTGMVHLGRSVQVADATKVPLAYLAQFMEEVRRCVKDGDLTIIALSTTTDSPITVSIAQSADTALLCVLLDKMGSSQAKKTVNQIGASRFIGSAIFHASGGLAGGTTAASPRP
jgi:hypothetical protein